MHSRSAGRHVIQLLAECGARKVRLHAGWLLPTFPWSGWSTFPGVAGALSQGWLISVGFKVSMYGVSGTAQTAVSICIKLVI